MVCAAPTLITPGNVQPRTGIGRSIAPVAIRIAPALTLCAAPWRVKNTSLSPVICQTRLSDHNSADEAANASASACPDQ